LENTFIDIDFIRFNELQDALKVPLVIHGTCLQQRFGQSLRHTLAVDPNLFDRLTIMNSIIPEVSHEAGKMIKLLGQ
jgi:fructose-bisphosphate aldolase class II